MTEPGNPKDVIARYVLREPLGMRLARFPYFAEPQHTWCYGRCLYPASMWPNDANTIIKGDQHDRAA